MCVQALDPPPSKGFNDPPVQAFGKGSVLRGSRRETTDGGDHRLLAQYMIEEPRDPVHGAIIGGSRQDCQCSGLR